MRDILAFYSQPMAGERTALFDALPDDVASLARAVPGLMLHQHIGPAYGEPIAPERLAEAQIRAVDDILACVLKHDGSALSQARPLSKRAIGVCRHFSLLLVAMLRHKHIPARARCGFGSYFETGKFIDHWVAEYWNGARWVMVDAQMDAVQRKLFRVDFDPLDVPRDRFLVAGDAWALCRAGDAAPDAFGILDMHGWAFIAGNVVRDVAALNDVVMLPWDVWGIMPHLGATLDEAAFRRFDDVALRTHEPDTYFGDLRVLYDTVELSVPSVVYNAVLQKMETI